MKHWHFLNHLNDNFFPYLFVFRDQIVSINKNYTI